MCKTLASGVNMRLNVRNTQHCVQTTPNIGMTNELHNRAFKWMAVSAYMYTKVDILIFWSCWDHLYFYSIKVFQVIRLASLLRGQGTRDSPSRHSSMPFCVYHECAWRSLPAALLECWLEVCRVKTTFGLLPTNWFVSTNMNSMKCFVNRMPLRICVG